MKFDWNKSGKKGVKIKQECMKRICSNCKEEKELNEKNFYKAPRNLYGYHMECILCRRKYQLKHKNAQYSKHNWTKMFCG